MNISILTVFEQLYQPFIETSLVRKAQEQGKVHIDVSPFFSYVAPKERIDAPTFGPGPGMLIKPEVVQRAVEDKEKKYGQACKIFFSPQGKKLNQRMLEHIYEKWQKSGHLMLLPARYEGMDDRVEQEYADEIISVGDFVLMGGDLPAMMLTESILRLVPGVVGKQASVEYESFTGPFVDYPDFTEPVEWKGYKVPDVVRSGNHAAIDAWRKNESVSRTVKSHFEWLRSQSISLDEKKLISAAMPNHYAALMHTDVLVAKREPGNTSVTSLDIHDIARSSRTYGLEKYFIVTPLKDQQKIVQTLLNFWQQGVGVDYNGNRHEAVRYVELSESLNQVIAAIEQQEGKTPLIIATSARMAEHDKVITYYDQEKVWQHDRPVLFIFGTGKGLTDEAVNRCDYLLLPIHGFSEFNHLSVRSAVAIILDRWLGINERIIEEKIV